VTEVHPLPRLSALLFSVSVFFNVAVWAFIAAMCISAFVYSNQGESAEAAGILWYFSLPIWAVTSFVSILAFPWFRAAESGTGAILRYAAVVLAAFAVAPLVWVVWSWAA